MSSKKAKGKTTKKRPQRATSNVFAMFDQSQIQEFKEAFNMIDQNRDGFVDKEDLHDMLASLGELATFLKLRMSSNNMPEKRLWAVYFAFFGCVHLQCLLSTDWLNKHVFIGCLMVSANELLLLNVIKVQIEYTAAYLSCR